MTWFSWTTLKAGKDVTYIETKFMNFDLTALAMLYHYRNHQFLELTWRTKSVFLECIDVVAHIM